MTKEAAVAGDGQEEAGLAVRCGDRSVDIVDAGTAGALRERGRCRSSASSAARWSACSNGLGGASVVNRLGEVATHPAGAAL